MQREIQNAAFSYQREIETKQRIIVGVNQFTSADTNFLLKVNPDLEEKHNISGRARRAQLRRRAGSGGAESSKRPPTDPT